MITLLAALPPLILSAIALSLFGVAVYRMLRDESGT